MKATQLSLSVLAALLVCSACKSNGPAPSEATPPGAEAPSIPSGVKGVHGITPEQQAAIDKVPRPEPDAAGNIDLGAMTVHVPASWKFVKPRALMRRAQFEVPGDAGQAETVIFFMGKAGAGSVDANIERWIRQFSNPDGTAVVDVVPKTTKIAGYDVTQLEVAGDHGGMTPSGQPSAEKSDQRLVAAIVTTPQGPYYIKLLGPNATVAANKASFEAMLASMKPNP